MVVSGECLQCGDKSPLSKALTSQRTPKLRFRLPAIQDFINTLRNRLPGVRSFPASAEQFVVVGFAMTNVGDYAEQDGVLVQALGGGRTANAAAVFSAGMLSDDLISASLDEGKEFADLLGELLYVLLIEPDSPFGLSFLSQFPDFKVCEALFLGQIERTLFDHESLPLVSPSRHAPFQDYG